MQKTLGPYGKRKAGFQRTSALVEQKLRAVSESRGFAITRLLTHWGDIVGTQISDISVPVKVSYAQKGFGATLVILTTGAQAQMLEMQLPVIREKVNACYGYNAITRVRITQTAPVGFSEGHAQFKVIVKTPEPNTCPDTAAKAASISGEIKDEGLKAALSAFGENILKNEKRP
ncbi:MAG: DUF721 domain-containing protein [Planktomarina sp.]|nr:DUF721 domain-containing protein [Planktomarina sp.]MDT2040224.1 DUF721 domain-containing protein [Planktomarina sp.]